MADEPPIRPREADRKLSEDISDFSGRGLFLRLISDGGGSGRVAVELLFSG